MSLSPEFGGADVMGCSSGAHCKPSPEASMTFAQSITSQLGGPEAAIAAFINNKKGRGIGG